MMCVICRIVKGEIPSYKVYEDERTLAFLDINPISNGHVLLVPKTHEQYVEDLSREYHDALFESLRMIVRPIQDAMEAPASNIAINNGSKAGQIIPHVHVHILPRKDSKGNHLFSTAPRVTRKDRDYFEGIAEKIREKIRS